MTVRGGNAIQYKEVFVGDVWFCGGQPLEAVHQHRHLFPRDSSARGLAP